MGEEEPMIDESQDVTLLAANQNDTHTILRFSRPYATCDENNMDITVSIGILSVQIIYSRELRSDFKRGTHYTAFFIFGGHNSFKMVDH